MGLPTPFVGICLILVGCCNAQEAKKPIMSCNFDDGLCPGWKHEEFRVYTWEVRTEPVNGTGPVHDHTTGNKSGGFLYFNDDSRYGRAVIHTPFMDLSFPPEYHCLRYWYYEPGRELNNFRIYYGLSGEDGGSWFESISYRTRRNDTSWVLREMSFPTLSWNKKLDEAHFNFRAGRYFRRDDVIAIDDVSVTSGPCPDSQILATTREEYRQHNEIQTRIERAQRRKDRQQREDEERKNKEKLDSEKHEGWKKLKAIDERKKKEMRRRREEYEKKVEQEEELRSGLRAEQVRKQREEEELKRHVEERRTSCGTETYDTRGNIKCCDEKLYDPNTHGCCDDYSGPYVLATSYCKCGPSFCYITDLD